MGGSSHIRTTQKAFDLLKSLGSSFPLRFFDKITASAAKEVDHKKDLELVDVEGGIGSGGRDNPHSDEWDAIDDVPHYESYGYNFTAFNHFIDIKKGQGIFDDFDGYSYKKGSASKDEFQDADDATNDKLKQLAAKILGKKVDSGINWLFNDEYVHAPGQKWYRECSPAVSRYSYYGDKNVHNSVSAEAVVRFPVAESTGSTDRGVPYSVFMPVDNLARFWYGEYGRTLDIGALGYVMHAIQDASIPHHAAGYCGNWHGEYEDSVDDKLTNWLNDQNFLNGAINLYKNWNQDDQNPPQSLAKGDYTKTPKKNWRIDRLVTWMALNACREYETTYNHFRGGKAFNENSARDLTQKALALCMLILNELAKIPRFDYEVTVVTGTVNDGGTNANVYISLFGGNGSINDKKIDDPDRDDFEKGSNDLFYLYSRQDLGDIPRIRIRHDNTGNKPGWYLEYIYIRCYQTGKSWTYPCQRWLAVDEMDHKTDLYLNALVDPISYRITVRTGSRDSAGTDANVYITLKGNKRTSREIYLDNPDKDDFERGQSDSFIFHLDDVGEIDKIRIRHDNSGNKAGWYLEDVRVKSITTGKEWYFPVKRWLARDEGDQKIDIEINKA